MRRIWAIGALLLAALLLSACEPVSLGSGTRVVTGGNFVLNSGETHSGPMLILGGDSSLQNGSRNVGDITVLGGNTNMNGEVNGNINIIGGNVNLGATALVQGNISVSGGNLNRSPAARITGSVNTGSFEMPAVGSYFEITPAGQLSWLVLRALLMTGLAALAVFLAPQPMTRMAHVLAEQPLVTAVVGFAAMLIVPVLAIVLALTIILIPISLLLGLVLALMAAIGWMALGLETGRRMSLVLKWEMQPVAQAALGTLAFTIGVGLIEFVPFVGGLTVFLATVLATGAVALTRFGTRTYTPPANVSLPPAPTTRPAGMIG